MTTATTLSAGDLVVIDNGRYTGQVFTVERVKTTKAIIRPHNELAKLLSPQGLNCPLAMLTVSDGAPPPPKVETYEPPVLLPLGTLVRLNRAFSDYTTETLMVVTSANLKTHSVAKLGGDQDRYLRVPVSGLTVVDVASVLA